jgi:hypothetical protein
MFQRVHVDADRLVGDFVGFLDVGDLGDSLAGGFCLGLPGDGPRFGRGFRRGRNHRGGRYFGCGLAEGALEFIERDFAGTKGAFQHLLHSRFN